MNTLLLGLAWLTVATQAGPLPDTDEAGRAYFEKLHRDRARITSGYVEYTVTLEKEPEHKDLEGSVRNYRHWFAKDRYRMDLEEVRPNDPANALDCRYSFSDGIYRIIDVDKADHCVREYTKKYLDTKPYFDGMKPPSAFPTLTDPRLIGIIGMEDGFLQHHRLDELSAIDPKATISVRRDNKLGKESAQVSLSYPNGSVETYTIESSSLLPSRMTTEFAKEFPNGKLAPDTRVEIETEVTSWPNARGERFDFPRRMKIRRIVEGEVESAETIAIRTANFNVPIDPADLTWKALQPARGAPMIYNDKYKRNNTSAVVWDGEKFAVVPAEPLRPPFPDPEPDVDLGRGSSLRIASYVLLGVAAVLATILASIKVFGRRRALA